MSHLNRDILYLIFKQLQDDKYTLYPCLLVSKTWCEMTIPILWKNPWKCLNKKNEMLFLSVIISHLSNTSRNKIGEHMLLTKPYQKPSFNYISYCRHLNLDEIQRIINNNIYENLKFKNEIINLFINENMKFTHLYIYKKFDSQIHFTYGAERCFSGIEFLGCSTDISDNCLFKLTETCKLVKKLELLIKEENNNYRIVKLIESQRRLFDVSLISTYCDISFYGILENSLIKHASTIQYCKITKPSTKLLSSFINLKKLELGCSTQRFILWNCIKNLSFPLLQILNSRFVSIEVLTSLIKNTNGSLIEIKVDYRWHNKTSNKKFIQAVYENCPNIKYLKLVVKNCSILELETLLIRCKYLDVLYILIDDYRLDWDKLFKVLTKSSSYSLFKFKFYYIDKKPKLETFKSLFNNWKGRHPMFLQIFYDGHDDEEVIVDLKIIKRYKEEGIIEKFDCTYLWKQITGDFEWI